MYTTQRSCPAHGRSSLTATPSSVNGKGGLRNRGINPYAPQRNPQSSPIYVAGQFLSLGARPRMDAYAACSRPKVAASSVPFGPYSSASIRGAQQNPPLDKVTLTSIVARTDPAIYLLVMAVFGPMCRNRAVSSCMALAVSLVMRGPSYGCCLGGIDGLATSR